MRKSNDPLISISLEESKQPLCPCVSLSQLNDSELEHPHDLGEGFFDSRFVRRVGAGALLVYCSLFSTAGRKSYLSWRLYNAVDCSAWPTQTG